MHGNDVSDNDDDDLFKSVLQASPTPIQHTLDLTSMGRVASPNHQEYPGEKVQHGSPA